MRGRLPTLSGRCPPQPMSRRYRNGSMSATENGYHFSGETPIMAISLPPPRAAWQPILPGQR